MVSRPKPPSALHWTLCPRTSTVVLASIKIVFIELSSRCTSHTIFPEIILMEGAEGSAMAGQVWFKLKFGCDCSPHTHTYVAFTFLLALVLEAIGVGDTGAGSAGVPAVRLPRRDFAPPPPPPPPLVATPSSPATWLPLAGEGACAAAAAGAPRPSAPPLAVEDGAGPGAGSVAGGEASESALVRE